MKTITIVIAFAITVFLLFLFTSPDLIDPTPYEGPCAVTVKVYDSQSTMNPVSSYHIKLSKYGAGVSWSTNTNAQGTVTFSNANITVPWSGGYIITLANTYSYSVQLTESTHIFTFYVDELS